MSSAAADARLALRPLLRSWPTFTLLIAVLGSAVGINTVLFSAIDAVWLKAVPYAHADRLVMVFAENQFTRRNGPHANEILYWRGRAAALFDGLAAMDSRPAFLGFGDARIRAQIREVEPHFFDLLGERVLLGRPLTEEDRGVAEPVAVVVTDSFFKQFFPGATDLDDSTFLIDSQRAVVVGVISNAITAIQSARVFRTLAPLETATAFRSFGVVGRLAERTSVSVATNLLNAEITGPTPNQRAAVVVDLRDFLVGASVGRTFALMAACSALVLILASVNATSLVLGYLGRRRNQVAMVQVLGATRANLLRQSLVLAGCLATASVMTGTALALAGQRLLIGLMPNLPNTSAIALNLRALVFALVVGAAITLVVAVIGAAYAGRIPFSSAIAGTGFHTKPQGMRFLDGILIGVQSALAVVVLSATTTTVASFVRLVNVDLGFQPEGLIWFSVTSTQSEGGPRGPMRWTPHLPNEEALLTQLAASPGVEGVATIDQLPLGGARAQYSLKREGKEDADEPSIDYRRASPGYFRTMGLRVIAGRDFSWNDRVGSPGVVLINQVAADKYWAGQDPLGKTLFLGGNGPFTIVGIVGNIRAFGLDKEPVPEAYRSRLQDTLATPTFVIRSTGGPAFVQRLLDGKGALLPATWTVTAPRTMDGIVRESIKEPRFRTTLLTLFGALSLLLTVVATYGVILRTTENRRVEIGIRLALGGTVVKIGTLLARQVFIPTLVGVSAGVLAAEFGISRLVEPWLADVGSGDMRPAIAAAAIVCAAATLALLDPLRRAGSQKRLAELRM